MLLVGLDEYVHLLNSHHNVTDIQDVFCYAVGASVDMNYSKQLKKA